MTGAASAYGLFRATRVEDAPQGEPLIAELPKRRKVDGAPLAREGADFYPTPPDAVRAFLAAEGALLRGRHPVLWEAAAGDGAMAAVLREGGFEVVCSDLHDRGAGGEIRDFLAFDAPAAPALVTNPPYSLCNWRDGKGRWIEHGWGALRLDYMALLLSWNWPAAGNLAALWAAMPPARVWLCRWKMDFTGQGAPPMLNAWFVWDRAWGGETVLRMLDRADARQGEMFGGEA